MIAGNGPISGLQHERWIEVGWTDDPYSIIEASDLFVLSNRETYFDIILLEVLSLGTPVIVSDNGGNRFFHRFKESMIDFFDYGDIDSMLEAKNRLKDREYKKDLKNINKKLFYDNFTIERFVNRYLDKFDLR